MNWIDRVIAPFAPRWALSRAHARSVLALYEVAQPSRLRKTRAADGSANAVLQRSGPYLRTLARSLEENLDIVAGALNKLENNIIGTAIMPEPAVMRMDGTPHKDLNNAIHDLFARWSTKPEITLGHDWGSAQRIMTRSWLRDGEVFAQMISNNDRATFGSDLRFAFEMLEADFCPWESTGTDVYNGIRFNAFGRPREYQIYKRHPGDPNAAGLELKTVSADAMLHLKYAKRLHQARGVSLFAAALGRFDDIKEIDESERVAARVAAAMSGFIKKGTPDQYNAAQNNEVTGQRHMDFAPGMIFDDLMPGEDIGVIGSNRPNNALIPFRDAQLRSVAPSLHMTFSSLAANYNGTYSAQRQELVESWASYAILSGHFVTTICRPIYQRVIQQAIAQGLISMDGADPRTIYDAGWTPPQMPWIDPKKESEANALMEDRGYKSRSQIVRERGKSPWQTLVEIQQDDQDAASLGLKFPRDQQPAAPEQPPENDDGDE